MVVSVVQIGNSRGVRLPKAILEQLKVTDTLELTVENDRMTLTPILREPRQGWNSAYQRMASNGDDAVLLPDESSEVFEWEW